MKWPAPDLDDIDLSEFRLPLELHRAKIADRRVPTFRIVEVLNVVEHIGPEHYCLSSQGPIGVMLTKAGLICASILQGANPNAEASHWQRLRI